MRTEFWMIGKTGAPYLREGIAEYQKRLRRYLPLEVVVLPDVKKRKKGDPSEIRREEAQLVLSRLQSQDVLILLDEKGQQFSSVEFAAHVDRLQQEGGRRLIFLVAGAYGATEGLKGRARYLLSLSRMTFSHQMIRLFFLEQLYRAMTILRNEPYHNL